MFDWFWKFLYSISRVLFEVIDGMLKIANKLCGVVPIQVKGEETSFMLTMLKDDRIMYGFIGAGLIGIFLLMIFGVFAICKNIASGKKTVEHVAIEVFKTLGYFLLVPTLMFAFTLLLNRLVQILYVATQAGYTDMGEFLFRSFLPPEMENYTGSVDWHSAQSVRAYMGGAGFGLDDYQFFFSWLVCIPLLICVAKGLLLFIDRTLSILILFIMSPISMSTTVLDDGQRFKLWREKVLSKYMSGYGMIIAVNIYIIVLSFITRNDVKFFYEDGAVVNWLLNFLMKAAFAIGGAFFLPKVFGLVGDLFVSGGGSREWGNNESVVRDMRQRYREAKADARASKADKEKKEKEKQQREEKAKNALGKGGSSGNANNNKMSGGSVVGAAVKGAIDTGKKAVDAVKENAQDNANKVGQGEGNGGGGSDKGKDSNQNDKKASPPGGGAVKNAVAGAILGSNDKKK